MKSLYNMIDRLNTLLNKLKKYANKQDKTKFLNISKYIKQRVQDTDGLNKLFASICSKSKNALRSIDFNEYSKCFAIRNIVDSIFLCITFTAIVLNVECYVNPVILSIQLVTLFVLSYAVSSFFPQKKFALKHAFICILATFLFYPIIALSYESEISVKLFKFLLIFSLFIELILRIDFSTKQKQNVIMYVGRYANINSFKKIEDVYNISIVIYAGSNLQANGLHLKSASYAIILEKIFRASKLFPTANKIIYAGNNSKHDFIDMLKIAKELNLDVLKANGEDCEKIREICIEDFFNEELEFEGFKLSQKKLCIQYNGNSILRNFILLLSQNPLCSMTILCQTELLATELYKDLSDRENCEIRLVSLAEFLKLNKPDIAILTIPYYSKIMASERLRESVKMNIEMTVQSAELCKEHGIHSVFIVSSQHAEKAVSWLGVSHRLAELYAQNIDYNAAENIRIMPVRLPDDIYQTVEKYAFNPREIACMFINFIENISNNEKYKKGRVYSIKPTSSVDMNDVKLLGKAIYSQNIIASDIGESFNPLNEKIQKYSCEGVTYTDFKKKGKFDLSELSMITSSKSIRDLLDIFLSSLYEKV